MREEEHAMEKKTQQTEKEEVLEADKQNILTAIKDFTAQLEAKTPKSNNNRQKLESILIDYNFNLKTKLYG